MEDLCVRPGQPATFSVVITGQPIPEIRWFKVWSNHTHFTHKTDTGQCTWPASFWVVCSRIWQFFYVDINRRVLEDKNSHQALWWNSFYSKKMCARSKQHGNFSSSQIFTQSYIWHPFPFFFSSSSSFFFLMNVMSKQLSIKGKNKGLEREPCGIPPCTFLRL